MNFVRSNGAAKCRQFVWPSQVSRAHVFFSVALHPPTSAFPFFMIPLRMFSSVHSHFSTSLTKRKDTVFPSSTSVNCVVTPGVLIPITYLRSKAWSAYFDSLYRQQVRQRKRRKNEKMNTTRTWREGPSSGRIIEDNPLPVRAHSGEEDAGTEDNCENFTAPLFLCPLCFSAVRGRKTSAADALQECDDHHRSSPSCLTSSSGSVEKESIREKKASLTEKSATGDVLPWRSPLQMMQHMSYSHMSQGFTPSEFQPYNDRILQCLVQRITVRERMNRTSGESNKGENEESENDAKEEDKEKKGVDTVSNKLYSSILMPRRRLRLLVWIDVANIDLGANEVLLEMLSSPVFLPILKHIPIGWCTTHELFVPHTCATVHGVYQLRLQHCDSEVFPFYAATRSESGDLTTSLLISRLRLATSSPSALSANVSPSRSLVLPPMILMTLDARQRQSVAELFGTGNAIGGGGREGVVVTPYNISISGLYHAFLDALGGGIG